MAIVVILLFSPWMFKPLVRFVSFKLQQFEVRLIHHGSRNSAHSSSKWPRSLQVLGTVSEGLLHL